jgi:hypothetical protein
MKRFMCKVSLLGSEETSSESAISLFLSAFVFCMLSALCVEREMSRRASSRPAQFLRAQVSHPFWVWDGSVHIKKRNELQNFKFLPECQREERLEFWLWDLCLEKQNALMLFSEDFSQCEMKKKTMALRLWIVFNSYHIIMCVAKQKIARIENWIFWWKTWTRKFNLVYIHGVRVVSSRFLALTERQSDSQVLDLNKELRSRAFIYF